MEDKKVFKFYVSLEMSVVIIFFIALLFFGGGAIVLVISWGKEDLLKGLLVYFALMLVMILFMFYALNRWLTKITISEKGIESSLFGKVKKNILWEELKDVTKVWRTATWVFFSKSDLTGLSYEKMLKRKDTISLQLTKEVMTALEYFHKEGLLS